MLNTNTQLRRFIMRYEIEYTLTNDELVVEFLQADNNDAALSQVMEDAISISEEYDSPVKFAAIRRDGSPYIVEALEFASECFDCFDGETGELLL